MSAVLPLPEKFIENMREMLGEDTPAFLRALEDAPALALRLNPKRPGAEEAASAFIDGPVPWAEHGRYLKPDVKPGASVAHATGAFYLQEASAMASASALDARPGEVILDLCAAPGGKSTQIAVAMGDFGALISNDPEPARARALAGNLERMGAMHAAVVSALPGKLAARWPETFDAILTDAPCSGEGMFRRDPDARGEWSPAAPEGCARRQAEILDQAARMLKPGGRLVYSTCTFNRQENEGSVLHFLDRHPEFSPEDFELPGAGRSEGGMLRLWPHRVRGDGHFVAKLRKAGEWIPTQPAAIRTDRETAALLRRLSEEVCALPEALEGMVFFRLGDRLYARPACCPDLDGLKVVSPGLCLMRVGRSHIEPEHALAMALPPECARRIAELDAGEAAAFLRGEVIPCGGEKGWTLATHLGLPLGWGKVSEGALKNHLPKGLRRPR